MIFESFYYPLILFRIINGHQVAASISDCILLLLLPSWDISLNSIDQIRQNHHGG